MKTDRELQSDVLEELDWEPSINASRIGVEVEDGIVTLQGTVDSYAQKWAAERATKHVFGVRGLAMELDVVLQQSVVRSDTDIAMAARNVIGWTASIPSGAVQVVVEKGWVWLSGQVAWAFIRDDAERVVHGLLGVKGVTNEIVVSSPVEPRDIKTKIEAALYRRAHVDAKSIAVSVKDGAVTLTGNVDSLTERDTVKRAAWNTPGVKTVIDHLVVA